MKKCVFAGTFDPPTTGHLSIVEKSMRIFDEVVVAVLINTAKNTCLTVDERVELLKELFEEYPQVKVVSFDGAAVDLLEKENTPFYVRGVRDCIDFDYERRDYYASKRLKGDLVEIFLPSEQDEIFVSSTLVRNSVKFEKDYSELLPNKIKNTFRKIMERKNV